MNGTLVSIIIANYNKAKYIAETIRSVLDQSYENFELIIIDDCSTDESLEIIADFADRHKKLKVFKNTRTSGANYSRNLGLRNAKGSYVIFLDADDLLAEQCLESRISMAHKYPEHQLLVFTMGVFKDKIGDQESKWLPVSHDPLKDFLKHELPWSILQPLWKREFVEKLGGFDEKFQRLQDVDLNTRALMVPGIKLMLFPGKADCYYRIDDARKNFEVEEFMARWVNSAVLYFNKFYTEVEKGKRKALFGTVYKTYLQLILQLRNGSLNMTSFRALEKKLFSGIIKPPGPGRRILLGVCFFYNTYCLRISGINKIISGLMTGLPA